MSTISFFGEIYHIPRGYIAVATRAVSSDAPNRNGDLFTPENLTEAAPTYEDCERVFVDHVTDDGQSSGVDRVYSRGYVRAWHMSDGVLYLLIFVSKKFPELCDALATGKINAVSMGCECNFICGICGAHDGCEHTAYLGLDTTNGYAYDILTNIEFKEISFVFEPADPSALIYKVVW